MWYIVVGLISGILGAMGMGGGTFLIPMLITFFGIGQKSAQFINLLAFVFTAIIAVVFHKKNNMIDFGIGTIFAFFGGVFGFVCSILVSGIEAKILQRLFGLFLIIIGIVQLVPLIKKTKAQKSKKY